MSLPNRFIKQLLKGKYAYVKETRNDVKDIWNELGLYGKTNIVFGVFGYGLMVGEGARRKSPFTVIVSAPVFGVITCFFWPAYIAMAVIIDIIEE